MQIYFHLFGHSIPAYGLLIVLGVITANLLGAVIIRRYRLDFNDFIILEAYAFLGGFLGAKVLYLAVSFQDIDWSRILEPAYFNSLMQGGFVFYGGLIGGIAAVLCASRLHKIPWGPYLRHCIFLIPLIHCFGRVGCFFAGCCYGIPWDGLFSVTFPQGSLAPAGVPLFPVQLAEAFCLLALSLLLRYLDTVLTHFYAVETYLISYGIIRFVLEFFRDDSARGKLLFLSTSQWISLLLTGCCLYLLKRRAGQSKAAPKPPAQSGTSQTP